MFKNIKMNVSNMKKETVLRHLKKGRLTFNDIQYIWSNDKELMMESIKQSSHHFYYISEELKDDKDVASLALESNIYVFSHVSERLREDKDLVLRVISQDVMLLKYASEDLQNEIEFLRMLRDTKHWLNDNDLLKEMKRITPFQTQWERACYENQKTWYQRRMDVLNILEDDIQMRKNICFSNKKTLGKKF